MSSPVCNICGGSLRPRFNAVLDPQTRESFVINECVNCGLGQTTSHSGDLSRYYGESYHGNRHGLTAAYCAKRRLQLVTRVAGPSAGRSLLDIGCGDGTFMLAVQKKGWRVAGTEINPSFARAAGLDVRESLEGVAALAPFSCVTLWHSLEHMDDPVTLLKSVAPLLAADGTLVVAVPNSTGLQARFFGPRWFHLDVPRHLYHFSRPSLARLFDICGLVITHERHQEFEYDLMGWSQSGLNTVMSTPNGFFDVLTGRGASSGLRKIAHCILGFISLVPALPLMAAGTLMRAGGTLIVAGHWRKRDAS